jgi:hypothetical protein
MIGIPFHSEAVAGVSVGGEGVRGGVRVAVRVGTAVKVPVGVGVGVGWAKLEQAVRIRANKSKQAALGLFTKSSF